MSAQHTPGPLHVMRAQFGGSTFVLYGADDFPIASTASNSSPEGMERARRGEHEANAQRLAISWNAHDELLAVAQKLTLLVDEGDDRMHGVYVDRAGVIRAKGSTLQLITDALAAIAKATGSTS